ncbi:MAG: response regulator [Longimicrobiales bacterium]|nr:response regulator [Longimicrobiales bacterium]
MPESNPLRILVVDDEQSAYLMIEAMLGSLDHLSAEVEWSATFEGALEALLADRFDVILVDYFLEERTGLDLLAEARDRAIRVPMIMVTGKGNREVDLQAMETGAADYLVKGKIEPDTLERSIRYAVERQRAADALRESEERHRGIFDHLPLGLYRCAPDGAFVDANPALVRMLGYPTPALLRERYARTFYLADTDREEFLAALTSEGEVRGFESFVLDTAGRPLRVRHTARAHRHADGTIEYIEGAVEAGVAGGVGITEKVAARYHTLTGALGLPLLRLDSQGRVIEISPAFTARTGSSGEDWIARPIEEIAGPQARADVEAVTSDPANAAPTTTWCFDEGPGISVRLAAVPDGVGEAEEILILPTD